MLSESEGHVVMQPKQSEWLWQDDIATASNRRLAERVLVDCEVDYGSDETFLFAQAMNISELGIFLQSREPQPEGTRLNLRFNLSPQERPLCCGGRGALDQSLSPGRPQQHQSGHGHSVHVPDRRTARSNRIFDPADCLSRVAQAALKT